LSEERAFGNAKQRGGNVTVPTIKLRVQKIDLADGNSGHWFGRAHIVTSNAHEDEYDKGTILLSVDCRCASEIVEAADVLIRELEKIKAEAKKVVWYGEWSSN
jgi:hypothetical protein